MVSRPLPLMRRGQPAPTDTDEPRPIQDLRSRAADLGVSIDIDRPTNPAGEWWLEAMIADRHETFAWRSSHGFGFFAATDADDADKADADYGARPDVIAPSVAEALRELMRRLDVVFAQS